jgi:dCMP deaminase
MKSKFISAHMRAAESYSALSSAKRLQVGCVIVKNDTIIGIGYNGMPSGWDNDCEDLVVYRKEIEPGVFKNELTHEWKTKPEVLHAETNAIAKVAKSTNSSDGAEMFITHAPCLECAKLIHQSGIVSVRYRNNYRSDDGVNFLKKCNIFVEMV